MADEKTKNIGIDSIEGDSLMKTIEEQSNKLNTMFSVDSDFNKQMGNYRNSRTKEGKLEDYATKNITSVKQALEASLSGSMEFKQSMNSMNLMLHKYFAGSGEKQEIMSQYEGLVENIASKFKFSKKWADKKLDERLSQQSIDKSTTIMLQHGKKIVQIISDHINVVGQAYKEVYEDKQSTSNYYKQSQEAKAHWSQVAKETLDDVKNLEGLMVGAADADRAKYNIDMDKAKLELHDATMKVSQYETIMNKSMEEAAILQKALDGYKQMKDDMGVIKTAIQQDVLHYAHFLPNTQKVFDAVRKVLGADMYGDNMRAAVNQGLEILVGATKAISQARAKMVSTQAISDTEWETMSQQLIDAYDIMQKGTEEAQANRKTNYARK
jgi:hypothetical protein